jgi:nitroreductase
LSILGGSLKAKGLGDGSRVVMKASPKLRLRLPLDICAFSVGPLSTNGCRIEVTDMIELLRARRSIRQYTGQPIESGKLGLLKEAVLRSPSSRNIDPWEFIFVEDRTLLQKLASCKPHGAAFLEHAALGIVICGDSAESDTWIEDCSIAAILVQMTAQALGLGSCWIQVRLRMFDDRTTSEQYVQKLLGIPEPMKVECMVALGYPAEKREPVRRAELKNAKVRRNTYAS